MLNDLLLPRRVVHDQERDHVVHDQERDFSWRSRDVSWSQSRLVRGKGEERWKG